MSKFFYLFLLHAFNDGFEASLLLFLPFIAKDMHLTLTHVGLLGSVENATRILLAVPAVYVARKFGSMQTLLFLVFIYSLSFFGLEMSRSFTFLFFVFIFAGLGFGMFNTIGLSLASQWSDKQKRASQMGFYSSSGDYGDAIIASIAVFLSARIGWRETALIYGFIGLLFFVLLRIFVHAKMRNNVKPIVLSTHASLLSFLKNKKFLIANAANLFDTLGGSAVYLFLPFLLLQKHIAITLLVFFTGAYFLGNISGKIILGKCADIFSNTTILIFSELCMGALMILLLFNSFIPVILMCCLLLGIFAKGTVPVIKTMVSESAEHYGGIDKAFGLNLIVGGTAATLSPFLFGYISNSFGILSAFIFSAVCSLIAIFPAYVYQWLKNAE